MIYLICSAADKSAWSPLPWNYLEINFSGFNSNAFRLELTAPSSKIAKLEYLIQWFLEVGTLLVHIL